MSKQSRNEGHGRTLRTVGTYLASAAGAAGMLGASGVLNSPSAGAAKPKISAAAEAPTNPDINPATLPGYVAPTLPQRELVQKIATDIEIGDRVTNYYSSTQSDPERYSGAAGKSDVKKGILGIEFVSPDDSSSTGYVSIQVATSKKGKVHSDGNVTELRDLNGGQFVQSGHSYTAGDPSANRTIEVTFNGESAEGSHLNNEREQTAREIISEVEQHDLS